MWASEPAICFSSNTLEFFLHCFVPMKPELPNVHFKLVFFFFLLNMMLLPTVCQTGASLSLYIFKLYLCILGQLSSLWQIN